MRYEVRYVDEWRPISRANLVEALSLYYEDVDAVLRRSCTARAARAPASAHRSARSRRELSTAGARARPAIAGVFLIVWWTQESAGVDTTAPARLDWRAMDDPPDESQPGQPLLEATGSDRGR